MDSCDDENTTLDLLSKFYENVDEPQLHTLRFTRCPLRFFVDIMARSNSWFTRFKMIRRLTFHVTGILLLDSFFLSETSSASGVTLDDVVRKINGWVDVPGRLTTVDTCMFTTWFWDAGTRGLLNCRTSKRSHVGPTHGWYPC